MVHGQLVMVMVELCEGCQFVCSCLQTPARRRSSSGLPRPLAESSQWRHSTYLSQSVGVGVAVEGDGGSGRADGGVHINNLGGVDDGIVGPRRGGGCNSENGGE
jgi:hypothetical protein